MDKLQNRKPLDTQTIAEGLVRRRKFDDMEADTEPEPIAPNLFSDQNDNRLREYRPFDRSQEVKVQLITHNPLPEYEVNRTNRNCIFLEGKIIHGLVCTCDNE